ncbi:MAG: sulfatase [Gemmataceae bacterium]|nr:sulfatase [Gemmataceae bacterium]MDW8265426.1 sulfatase [Gemmataceae bacterium]
MTGRLVIALGMLLAQAPAALTAEGRLNVLFIISDDLNNFLGCYGDPRAKTPNIDRLAARGVVFERAYCTFPLCAPSRNSMLTGLYPNSTGILANQQIFRQTIPGQISLPQAFRRAGYFVGRIGKLYHYNVPSSIGTAGHDDPASWELQLNPAGCDRLEEEPHIFSLLPGRFGGTLSWYASPKSDEHHTDGMIAEQAEWVLERCARKKDRPFFLAVGFFRPHTPYVAPKKPYFDWYPEKEMPVVQGIKEDQADLPPAALGSHKKEQEKLTDDLRRQCVQAYYASISFMDAQVGRVINALDRLGLADHTVVVFTSDHGYHLGEHGLWQKMSLFEESARVPLLIVAPGMSRKAVVKAPVSQVDLYPTLAELCGVKAPDNLQGQSLVPMLKDPSFVGRGWALTQVMRGGGMARATVSTDVGSEGPRFFGYTLRTARWRYTEWDEGRKGRELYDHDTDPKELRNLALDAAYARTVEELSQQLRAAVKSSFPPSGQRPELQPGTWPPTLVEP